MAEKKDCGCNVMAQLSALPCKNLANKIPKAIFALYKKGEISANEAVQIASQLKGNLGRCGGAKSERIRASKRLTSVMGMIRKGRT